MYQEFPQKKSKNRIRREKNCRVFVTYDMEEEMRKELERKERERKEREMEKLQSLSGAVETAPNLCGSTHILK